ncbi:DNA-binding response regulator [Amycolatopsis sp.]|jgi:DNA-binding NarL/FixJ family response regulator|uniref:DNA-binding response regulator n=1 Tax=Amycolatopsis sp. TaxID=37632 RepID=UPI002E093FC9|nr:DNA-binding response regulator [Amycolatopsis sp.]
MKTVSDVVVVHGEQELFDRAGHLFEGVTDMACAANDLHTWSTSRPRRAPLERVAGRRIRKIYRPGVLLDPSGAAHLREVQDMGATIKITRVDINETILLDNRVAILAGGLTDGVRSYSVISNPDTVQGVLSLFEVAWGAATELAVYDARIAEIRLLAPQILELLASGCKDETAARTLGLGVRTYRRRVAELMTALDASSRFQAGARARELGLI